MLWGIDPLLDADLLYALRRMGHGDEIAVVDTNYPAASTAMSTVTGEPLLMAGVSAARAVEAILSVMPLDTFVPDPAGRMEVVGDPDAIPPVQREVQQVLDRAAGKHVPLQGIERFDFYERARNAFVILITGERRLLASRKAGLTAIPAHPARVGHYRQRRVPAIVAALEYATGAVARSTA